MLVWQLIKTRCFNAQKQAKVFKVTENKVLWRQNRIAEELFKGQLKRLWSTKEYEWFPGGKLSY